MYFIVMFRDFSENGLLMFLWVGANVAHEWTHSIFGDHLAAKIEIDPTSLPVFDNPMSRRLRQVIDLIRTQRHRSMKVKI
jgi:protein transport protein SEC24